MLSLVSNTEIWAALRRIFSLASTHKYSGIQFSSYKKLNESRDMDIYTQNTRNSTAIHTMHHSCKNRDYNAKILSSKQDIQAETVASHSIERSPHSSKLGLTRGSRHSSAIQKRRHKARKEGKLEKEQLPNQQNNRGNRRGLVPILHTRNP